jgi:hypothetical protein
MFICLVHDDGGSMYEATNAQQDFGPFPTRAKAKAEAEKFEKKIEAIQRANGGGSGISYWVNIYEIPNRTINADEAIFEWRELHDYDED